MDDFQNSVEIMLIYFFQGLLLGFAYVAPIGVQNLYLINTSLRETGRKAFAVASAIIFFDISLALACFFGIGILIDTFPVIKGIILLSGSILVIYIGFKLINSSLPISNDINLEAPSFIKVISICFIITWFNPQALIDGSLLLGGFYTALPREMSNYFIFGVCVASFTWFMSLTTLISIFRSKFTAEIINCINKVCGIIIMFYGIKLGYSFIQLIK